MPVTIPRRIQGIGPYALQIRGQPTRTGRRDQQIAAELKIESHEPRVGRAFSDRLQSLGDRLVRCLARLRTEPEADAIEIFLKVRTMSGEQRWVAFSLSFFHICGRGN